MPKVLMFKGAFQLPEDFDGDLHDAIKLWADSCSEFKFYDANPPISKERRDELARDWNRFWGRLGRKTKPSAAEEERIKKEKMQNPAEPSAVTN